MYSLYLARENLNRNILLVNGDVIVDPAIIGKLIDSEGTCVAYDRGTYNEESMKIVVKDNRVSRISKRIPWEEADGCSVDLYRLSDTDSP